MLVEVDGIRVQGQHREKRVVGLGDRTPEPAAIDVADLEVLVIAAAPAFLQHEPRVRRTPCSSCRAASGSDQRAGTRGPQPPNIGEPLGAGRAGRTSRTCWFGLFNVVMMSDVRGNVAAVSRGPPDARRRPRRRAGPGSENFTGPATEESAPRSVNLSP